VFNLNPEAQVRGVEIAMAIRPLLHKIIEGSDASTQIDIFFKAHEAITEKLPELDVTTNSRLMYLISDVMYRFNLNNVEISDSIIHIIELVEKKNMSNYESMDRFSNGFWGVEAATEILESIKDTRWKDSEEVFINELHNQLNLIGESAMKNSGHTIGSVLNTKSKVASTIANELVKILKENPLFDEDKVIKLFKDSCFQYKRLIEKFCEVA